jgi:uncharacterized protein (TIGR03435 family)
MHRFVWALAVGFLAQAAGPTFEVASVKANTSGDLRATLTPQPGGRFTATNVTLAALIRFAYDLPDFQVSGGPGWINSDRFDVLAKAEGDAPAAGQRLMLQRLLSERFKVVAHIEPRSLPIYALIMSRSDGRMGPQLRRTELDCTQNEQATIGLGLGDASSNGPPRCGFFGFAPGTDLPSGRGGLAFRGLTMAGLAKRLAVVVRRTVVDETGLTGYFDGEFDFIAELPIPPPPPGVPSPFARDPFASIFAVFPQQLGLKLDARRGPVEVLVIEGAERPLPE